MEQNLNFEYKGFKANGFVMFFVSLAVMAAGVWGIVNAWCSCHSFRFCNAVRIDGDRAESGQSTCVLWKISW